MQYSQQEARVLRSLRFWIGLAVSLLFVALLLHSAQPGKILDALRGANYIWLLPAVLLYLASLWVRSLRYRYLVRDLVDVPATELYPIICIAFMANNLLPARAGELVRAYVMGERYGISKVSAVGTVIVERLCDGLTLLLFLLVTVLALGANTALKGLALVSLVVFLGALVTFASILRWPERSETVLHRLTEALPRRVRPLLRELASSLLSGMVALRDPRALLAVIVCSPLAWSMEACCFWLVGQGFGLHLNVGWYVMAMAAGNLALAAPSSQGGIGPFEYFAEQVLIVAGISQGSAAAYALAVHAVVIVPVTLLGLVLLSIFNISLGAVGSRQPAVVGAVGSGQWAVGDDAKTVAARGDPTPGPSPKRGGEPATAERSRARGHAAARDEAAAGVIESPRDSTPESPFPTSGKARPRTRG